MSKELQMSKRKPKPRRTKRRQRSLGSPPDVHLQNANAADNAAIESASMIGKLARSGDCKGALDELETAAYWTGRAEAERSGADLGNARPSAKVSIAVDAARYAFKISCLKK
jgi:hypothetical protein